MVKARMAAVDRTTVSTVDDLEHALEERLETGHIIGLSLILDVLELHEGDAQAMRRRQPSVYRMSLP